MKINGIDFTNFYLSGQSAHIPHQLQKSFQIQNDKYVFENFDIVGDVTISQDYRRQNLIEFNGINFGGLKWSAITYAKPLLFYNCTFLNPVHIAAVTFTKGVTFLGCNFQQGVFFRDVTSDNLNIDKCKIQGDFHLIGSSGEVRLSESEFIGLSVEKCALSSLLISSGKSDTISITGGSYEHIFFNRFSTKKISFFEAKYSTITFAALQVEEKLGFADGQYGVISIEDLSGPGRLELHTGNFEECLIIGSSFEQLLINKDIKNKFSVEQTILGELNCKNIVVSGEVRFSEVEITEGGKLSFLNCDFKKTSFLNCNFRNCNFEFLNSKVQELFLAQTDFPRHVVTLDGNKRDHHQAQLVFGQLQNTYTKQGDSVRASEYLSREVAAHYDTISWISKRFLPLSKKNSLTIPYWFNEKIFTKISLFLSKISTSFGRNWFQGALFTFTTGFVFFIALLISTSAYEFSWPIKFRGELTDSFLKFMNPLRHFETENIFSNHYNYSIATSCSYVIDFFGRIFITFGYYQTIQAFRRFGKK